MPAFLLRMLLPILIKRLSKLDGAKTWIGVISEIVTLAGRFGLDIDIPTAVDAINGMVFGLGLGDKMGQTKRKRAERGAKPDDGWVDGDFGWHKH